VARAGAWWRGLSAVAGHPGTAAPVGDHGPHEPAAACRDHCRCKCYLLTRIRLNPGLRTADAYQVVEGVTGIVSHMRSRVRTAVVVIVLGASTAAFPLPALAAPTCTYDAPTMTVTVALGNGESATIARSVDLITLDGVPCDVATVQTTDTIVVNGTGDPTEVTIDLSGGPFEPGATPETDGGASEIEFTIDVSSGTPTLRILGSNGVDCIVAGASGINLNSDETTADADVTITGTPDLVIEGRDGDDTLSLAGGAGTGTTGVRGTLLGQAGNDHLSGAISGSAFDGGDGTDEIDYTGAIQLELANLSTGQVTHQGGGTDTLAGIENLTGSPGDDRIVGNGSDNVIDGGDGIDTIDFSAASAIDVDLRVGSAVGEGTDRLSSIENVIGSPLEDHIVGGGGGDRLDGGPGDDKIDGGGGDDALIGGEGSDTVSFQSATEGVTVSLKKGTAEGAGADTIEGFENVVGTLKADEIQGDGTGNRLDGRRGPDRVSGGGGADIILGGDGNDVLFGQRGDDLLLGDSGKDQLDGGKDPKDVCKGGPGPDSFVFCETVHAGPRSIRLI
jgi:Ca2+-binding RTX toxin-like protein